jgi:hypothetical protein
MVTRDEKNSTAAFDLNHAVQSIDADHASCCIDLTHAGCELRNIDASSQPCGGISVSGIATMNERVVYFWRQTAHTNAAVLHFVKVSILGGRIKCESECAAIGWRKMNAAENETRSPKCMCAKGALPAKNRDESALVIYEHKRAPAAVHFVLPASLPDRA